jgi:RNA polymerase sigma-70 factor, ECF subfamily
LLILLISTLNSEFDRERGGIDESDLVDIAARARRRDPDAFGQLFDLFFDKLKRYAYYRTGDMQAAEDLASETLTNGLESIDRFTDRGGSIGAWLFGIERNLIARHREASGRGEAVELSEEVPSAEEDAPDTLALDRLTHEQLYAALSRLPEDQRDVILLRFMERHDVKTVGRLIGKKPGAVRALQFRAITALRNILGAGERA